MARPPREALPERLQPSILDRLLGGDGDLDSYGLDEMYASVRRDLEDLLNTHAPPIEPPEDCVLLRRSVAAYGLPDLASLLVVSERDGIALSRVLEDILGRFEPRLKDVRVIREVEPDDAKLFRMRFQIEARLAVEPYPNVAFQTVLEIASGRTSVSGGS